LFPVFEGGGVDWCLVDLVKEELVRVWIEGLGVGPTLADWWVLVGEFWVHVDFRVWLGVVDGEKRATHRRLDEGEDPFVDDDVGFEKKNKQERKMGGVCGWQLIKDAF